MHGGSLLATSPFWASDNGAGVSTLYNGAGQLIPLVVTIAPPGGSPPGDTLAAPTGTVFNPTNDFVVTKGTKSGKALFIFATEDGTVSGWNPGVDSTHSILGADNSARPRSTRVWLSARRRAAIFYATKLPGWYRGRVDKNFSRRR